MRVLSSPSAPRPTEWRCGELVDASTPYDLGFLPGEHAHIQDRGEYSIVCNGRELRWVTPYQVVAYIEDLRPCDQDWVREYVETRAALLASSAGRLTDLIAVESRSLPARIPSKYQGCPIIVSDTSPVTDIAGWMGEHLVGEDGDLTIYLETEYVEAALAAHRYDILWATFRHERFESRCELALARAEFPTAKERQLGGLAICMNGLAHKMTLRMLKEAPGEREYNDLMDRQRSELGLAPL